MKTILSLLLLCASTVLLNAQVAITGKITDEKRTPVQGVIIMLKGTKTVTVSDVNGFYSIQVPDKKAILVFTGVGFDVQEIKVKSKTVINVTLKASTRNLDEVVVMGYATSQ